MTPLELFNEHKALASNMGRKWVRNNKAPNHITPEDASQVALEALWLAAKNFDEGRSDDFKGFAVSQIRYALLNLWKSSKGGRMLGGIATKHDNDEAAVVDTVGVIPETQQSINKEDEVIACMTYGKVIKLLPKGAKTLLELSSARTLSSTDKHIVGIIRDNLKAAVRSDNSDATIKAKLRGINKPGFGCKVFKYVKPIANKADRNEAVRAASKLYNQQVISILFGVSKSSVSGYVNGSYSPSAELAGACAALADNKITPEEVSTIQWVK